MAHSQWPLDGRSPARHAVAPRGASCATASFSLRLVDAFLPARRVLEQRLGDGCQLSRPPGSFGGSCAGSARGASSASAAIGCEENRDGAMDDPCC